MSEVREALLADVMRYVARNGEVQSLVYRHVPLDLESPVVAVSDLRYLSDVFVEAGEEDYGGASRPRLVDHSYTEVTLRNAKGEVYVRQMRGSFDEVLFNMLTEGEDVVGEVPFEG